MKKENCLRKEGFKSDKKRDKVLSIRITTKNSEWMRENNFSPTAIFDEACSQLGFKE